MLYKSNLLSLLMIILSLLSNCTGQEQSAKNSTVGGVCEGCEAIFEYGSKTLSPIDTLPKFQEENQKLKISGTVLMNDGITPAENIILYIYQTNSQGIYETRGDEQGWGKRHGYIRGWIKTGKDGGYTFYTFRPNSYPDGEEPAHIHIVVKELERNEYYIDDFVFENDPLLTKSKRNNLTNRGGSGLANPKKENGILSIERTIILGLNIPQYD